MTVKQKGAATNGAAPTVDIGALIDSAKLPERTVDVCLRGDLQAEWEDLQRQLQQAQNAPRTSLADGGDEAAIADQIEALQEQMAASTVVFRLRALPRRQFRDMVADHPPRDGDQRDHAVGYNTDTLEPALIRACMYEPEVTDDQWQRLVDEALTTYQYGMLANACTALNLHRVDVPFSHAASLRRQGSAES